MFAAPQNVSLRRNLLNEVAGNVVTLYGLYGSVSTATTPANVSNRSANNNRAPTSMVIRQQQRRAAQLQARRPAPPRPRVIPETGSDRYELESVQQLITSRRPVHGVPPTRNRLL